MLSVETRLARLEPNSPADVAVGLKLPLTLGDVSFLVEEIYRGRSAVSGLSTRLVLVRWWKPKGSILRTVGEGPEQQKTTNLRFRDLVCMTKEEAKEHEKAVLSGAKSPEEFYDAETIEKVASRMQESIEYEKHRA